MVLFGSVRRTFRPRRMMTVDAPRTIDVSLERSRRAECMTRAHFPRPAGGCSWLPSAEAEDLSMSSSSCPCDRCWRPSRESSVLHALARLPDRLASRRHSVCLGGNPCRGFPGCDRQGSSARLRAKEFTSLRAASSCSRRSSIRAAGARQGRPRERRHTGQHGFSSEESRPSNLFQ